MYDLLIMPFAEYGFMARALLVLLALSVGAGAVGVLVNLRDLEFISDGLVHAVFPGVAVGAVFFSNDGITLGAAIAGTVAAVVLTVAATRFGTADAPVAVVLTAAFSLGVVVVSTSSYPGQLESLLFGQLLGVHLDQVRDTAVIAVVVLVMLGLTRRAQLFRAFDPDGAQAAGYRPLATDLVLNLAIALVIVAGSRVMGNLLVLAILIVPAAAARNLTRTLAPMALGAMVIAGLGSWLGLSVAFDASMRRDLSLSPSGTVVLSFIALYALSLAWRGAMWAFGRRRSGRMPQPHPDAPRPAAAVTHIPEEA